MIKRRRRRFKHLITLQDRIIAWVHDVRAQAAELPPGPDREMLMEKVRQAETAMQWVNSPGLRPPK